MATYTLALSNHQFFDDSGNPLANGRVYTYASGTSTALSAYMTSAGTAWGAYVQLDSAGRPENGEIYLQPGQSYKWIIQSQAGVVVDTVDPVPAVPPSAVNVDIPAIAGTNIAAGDVVYLSKGDGALTPGSWYLADADLVYASSGAVTLGMAPNAIASGETGSVRIEGQVTVTGPLAPGTSYYVSATAGGLTATQPTNARFVGQADTTSSIVIVPNPVTDVSPDILFIDCMT